MTVLIALLLSGVATDWTGHTVAAAAPLAELLPGDREHLDAGLRQLRVRRLVALVGDHDPRRERDDVVAVVPLVALGLELVAARGDELQVRDPERVLDLVDEREGGNLRLDARRPARREPDRED